MTQGEAGRNGGAGDAGLVRSYAASHSPESLRILVDRYGTLVRGVGSLYLRATPGMADDAARAAFLALAREAASLGKHKQLFLAGWLHGVAVLAASSVRSQKPGTAGGDVGSPGMTLSGAGRETLHDAIRSLPPRQRESLVLGCLCGVSEDEMSRRLELPQGEVRSLIDKGRMRLGRDLETAGMDANEASVASWLDDEAKAIAEAAVQDSGRPLVAWKDCSADEPLGNVSQTVWETADRVAGQMTRSVVGRRATLVAAAAVVVAIAAAGAILLFRPPRVELPQENTAVIMQVAAVSGVALVTVHGKEATPLKEGDTVPADASLRTERSAELTVTHPNGSRMLMRENTEMDVAFDKGDGDPVLLLKRGALVAEPKGGATLRTEHVAATVDAGRLTLVVGKTDKPFTRIDVERGTVKCVREGVAGSQTAPVSLKAGFAGCFSPDFAPRVMESDGHEIAAAGGGVFFRNVMKDYDLTGMRLDEPRFAHMATMWSQKGGNLESHFSGDKTADAGIVKDENMLFCWAIRARKGQDGAEERLPIRAEGDVLWASMLFAVKPGTGPISAGLAGDDFVPDSLPAAVKKNLSGTAGGQPKIEPMTKTTWTLKWALVGVLPDGLPLYEYESKIGSEPAVKGWRAGAIEKTRVKFTGAEFRIYEIKGGALEKVPVQRQE